MKKTKLKVETFKANNIVSGQIDSLARQLNMNRSKVIRLAISKMHSETINTEEGS